MSIATTKTLLTPREVADRLSVSVGTLAVWRCRKSVPLPYVTVGRAVRYEAEAVEQFIEAQTVRPGADQD